MKAVSAQCLTVGNQNSTVKETTYSHSTQRPQLTPSIQTFTVSVSYCFPLKKCTPTVILKSMIRSHFTAFFATSSSSDPCFIVRIVGWMAHHLHRLHSYCAVTAWGEKWLEDNIGDWLGWTGLERMQMLGRNESRSLDTTLGRQWGYSQMTAHWSPDGFTVTWWSIL